MDPHAANTGPNILIAHQIYEPLIVRQFDGWMVPALALSWSLTADPTVWEFRLRPNVTFHDGSAFTADDVVFSIERARGEGSDMLSLLSSVESVTRVDDQRSLPVMENPQVVVLERGQGQQLHERRDYRNA